MDKIFKQAYQDCPIDPEIPLSDEVKEIDAKIKETPDNAELWMERGLALAKIRLMRESVEAFSNAIALEPFCGIYYRHRAHRFLSCWDISLARTDFVMGARLAPDNWDIWYHLGLAHFLLGEYEKAEEAYRRCLELTVLDLKRVAIVDWYWMTLMRLNKREEAKKLLDEQIHENMDVGYNIAYYKRLLMYKGLLTPEELLPENEELSDIEIVTRGFGLSNYYFLEGNMDKSNKIIDKVLNIKDKKCHTAFGYVASLIDKINREKQEN